MSPDNSRYGNDSGCYTKISRKESYLALKLVKRERAICYTRWQHF